MALEQHRPVPVLQRHPDDLVFREAPVHPDLPGDPPHEEAAHCILVGIFLAREYRGVVVNYGVANASACTPPKDRRRWPRWVFVAGFIGCGVLAFSLPLVSISSGTSVLLLGAAVYVGRDEVARRLRKRGRPVGALFHFEPLDGDPRLPQAE